MLLFYANWFKYISILLNPESRCSYLLPWSHRPTCKSSRQENPCQVDTRQPSGRGSSTGTSWSIGEIHKLNRIADSDCLFSSIQINLLTNDVYNYNNNLQQQWFNFVLSVWRRCHRICFLLSWTAVLIFVVSASSDTNINIDWLQLSQRSRSQDAWLAVQEILFCGS